MNTLKELNENELKETVKNTIRRQMIDTKYNDESITFGQAVVTHHYFLTQQQNAMGGDPKQYQNQINRATTPLQMLESMQNAEEMPQQPNNTMDQQDPTMRERSRSPHQVIQFDLANEQVHQSELDPAALKQFPGFGRRKSPRDDCRNVREALIWREPDYEFYQKKFGRELIVNEAIGKSKKTPVQVQQIVMQRSPQKWKTMYRDQYRKFKESPQRDVQQVGELNIQDNMGGGPDGGVEDVKPSDMQAEYGEHFAPTSNEASNLNRSQKYAGRHFQAEVGSGLVEKDAASIDVNEDLRAAVTPPNVIHEPQGEKRRVMIMQEDDSSPKKKKERPMTAEEKALKKKVSEINSTTRWLADSAFTTYFGKPAFHAYGKGNTRPVDSTQQFLTHNINGVSGKQKTKYQQVYNSALIAALEKNSGVRVPKLPKQKEKFLPEKKMTGAGILPKTLKEQKEEIKKTVKGGQISIKITKPRLTIDGFKMDPPEHKPADKKSERKSPKSRQSRSKRGKNDSRERISTSEAQSKGQQSSILNGAKGLDESIQPFSRGRSDGRPPKEVEEQDARAGEQERYYEDTLDEGHQEDDMQDHIEGPDDEDEEGNEGQGVDLYDDDYQNYQGSPGAAGARQCLADLGPDHSLAPHEKDPRIYAQLPSCYTRRIAPAGRGTYKSESAYNVLFGTGFGAQR